MTVKQVTLLKGPTDAFHSIDTNIDIDIDTHIYMYPES